jgi:methylphosphotriester-DNA--protein-cysteine methyltransferase
VVKIDQIALETALEKLIDHHLDSPIDFNPVLPMTTSVLAAQCHVSARTLQEGFQRHLGVSPKGGVKPGRSRGHRHPSPPRTQRVLCGFLVRGGEQAW